jgi:aldehyde:ferredoxin oxidoreductase
MLEEYYAFRGWDKNGMPGLEKLQELSLDFAIEEAHD